MWLSEQTVTFTLYVISRLVFITEVESVYSAVRTESDYIALMCFVWLSEQTVTFALYVINRLGFITEVERVYSAVRTESLYRVAQKNACFSNNCNFVYFQYKKLCQNQNNL